MNYMKRLSSQALGSQRYVIFQVTRGSGGLGDRLRGMATAFYLAISTDSVFVLGSDWNAFERSSQYNQVLRKFGVSPVRQETASHELLIDIMNQTFWEGNFKERWRPYNKVTISTNSPAWLAVQARAHQSYTEHFNGLTNLDMFRISMYYLCPSYSSLFQELPVINSILRPSLQLKLGVHIRLGGLWGDPMRAGREAVNCFATKIKILCTAKPCLVYITGDDREAVKECQKLIDSPHIEIVYSTHNSTHIDKDADKDSVVGVFVDWIALTCMDHLLISRSGFSETASWYSLVPSEQLLPSNVGSCSFIKYDNLHGFQYTP